jgi:hypothetical protein
MLVERVKIAKLLLQENPPKLAKRPENLGSLVPLKIHAKRVSRVFQANWSAFQDVA